MGGDRALTDDANKTGIASWRKQMPFWGVFGVFFLRFLGVAPQGGSSSFLLVRGYGLLAR
jgi:hypothetical protein